MTNIMVKRKEQAGIRSLGDLKRSGVVSGKIDPEKFIRGPQRIDCLERPLQRGDCTGILAGTGVGKTTFALWILKNILINNPEGIVAFISLEMTASEIGEKWFKATEGMPELADRLYIIENYDEDGKSLDFGISDIKIEMLKIKETLGQTIHAYALDHFHEINIGSSVDYNPLARKIKNLTVELDTHGFILSQTTKEKGVGDIPVPKDGCFGCSRFENLMTNIITVFQPLRRVEKECNMSVMGFQYAKIRYKNKNDKIKEGMNYLSIYDFDTEDLLELDLNETTTFKMYYDKVLELRKNEAKYKSYQFNLSTEVRGKDGQVVTLDEVFGGGSPDDDEL
jgi:KaiC/GvpD/RAD55 family RecA-like ATPase|tara:strand:- start:62 stop:1075 length:1014 start_codon:yes stop_codon:yes gene_type:complete